MKGVVNVIALNIGAQDPTEFIQDFQESVLETLMLIFERRELDLQEDQLYALYVLAKTAKSCQGFIPVGPEKTSSAEAEQIWFPELPNAAVGRKRPIQLLENALYFFDVLFFFGFGRILRNLLLMME